MDTRPTVSIVGTGIIGAGWAARMLHFGIDVVATDVDAAAEPRLRGAIANAEHALSRLTIAPIGAKGTLRFTTDLEAAVSDAWLVQENALENEPLKRDLLERISRAAPREALIASSTSGLLVTRLQADCVAPGRVLVGHPFNPVYLLPLVEVVGGELTDETSLEAAGRFYEQIGMHVLRVRHEVPGHLSDRLQEAMWREILHMIADGVATTGELDRSIVYGPGLRWAVMGTCLTFHLAGGESGMRHMLEQFGPALELPWTHLEAPELTPALVNRMVEGTTAQADGRTVAELERVRDDCLLAIMQVLRDHDIGAGQTLRRMDDAIYARAVERRFSPDDDFSKPLRLFEHHVRPEWVDYNGHMTESRYLELFGHASDALFTYLGIDSHYHDASGTFHTVETHLKHLREVRAGVSLYVTTQLLAADEKRLRVFNVLHRADDDERLATGEQMYLHVGAQTRRAAPMTPELAARLSAILERHRALPVPAESGAGIDMRASKKRERT